MFNSWYKSSPFYTLILDSSQGISKIDQLSIIIRYVTVEKNCDNYHVKIIINEVLLSFESAGGQMRSITSSIITLKSIGLHGSPRLTPLKMLKCFVVSLLNLMYIVLSVFKSWIIFIILGGMPPLRKHSITSCNLTWSKTLERTLQITKFKNKNISGCVV